MLLDTQGERVFDVPPNQTDRERGRQTTRAKSDEQDALAIARIALRERERLVAKVIAVDHFDPDEITGKSAIGHNSRPANAFDKPPHAALEEIHAAE